MTTLSLRNILDKMDNSDSDYRYMATSDFLSQLQASTLQADHDTQKRLCRAVLKLLKDSNSEVQGMATKCLAPLTFFVDLSYSAYLVEKLLDHVLDVNPTRAGSTPPDLVGQKAVRDVAALGLKSIVQHVPIQTKRASIVAKAAVPRMVSMVANTASESNATDAIIDTLELLNELLSRLGHLVPDFHAKISDALIGHFRGKSPLVRKRAVSCLAALAAVCDNEVFVTIVNRTLELLQSGDMHHSKRTGVQVISALSKSSGHRLGSHLDVLVPILFSFASQEINAEDDDLCEHCLQALESFTLRCRREMLTFASTLAKIIVELAKYDPNYVVEEDEDGAMDEGDANDADEEDADDMRADEDMLDDFDDEDYSDDDDSSWKVRRAAVRCMHAMITVELLPSRELCTSFGPFLIARFKEREENVKLDVFEAFSELLRKCCSRSLDDSLSSDGSATRTAERTDTMAIDNLAVPSTELEVILSRGSQIVRNLKRELASRSPKTRMKAMCISRVIASSLPSLVQPLLSKVLPEVRSMLADPATGIKTEALLFLQSAVRSGGASALKDHMHVLVPSALAAGDDRYYKVTAECLRFCVVAVGVFGVASRDAHDRMAPLVPAIFDASIRRAPAQDQDSEVKEAALQCLGNTVAYFGSSLRGDRLDQIAFVLRDRLGNDVTRIAAVRALNKIAGSESAYVLAPAMTDIANIVSGFLRKNHQALRMAAIELLSAAPQLPSSIEETLTANIGDLITDSDLRVASLALHLATKIVKDRGAQIFELVTRPNSIYPKALALSKSPLLQGRAVDALLELFSSLANANGPTHIRTMLRELENQAADVSYSISTSSARGSPLLCISKCIVAVCRAAEANLRIQTTERIIGNVKHQDVKVRIFALAYLGEFGRSSLLPREGSEKEAVRSAVLDALDASNEDVKTAAAVALGGLASSDGASGVPALVELILQRPAHRYLLLLALKEAISSTKPTELQPLVPLVLPLLLEQPSSGASRAADSAADAGGGSRSSEDESVRTVIAECLGLLTQICLEDVLPKLTSAASSADENVRAAVATAVKFAVSSSGPTVLAQSSVLWSSLDRFIMLIGDGDVTVAKNAIQAVNTIAKSRPNLLVPYLPGTLPQVYKRTAKVKELVRIVDLGPFKIEEDYGLELRKSAFDCLRTFLSGPLCSSVDLVTVLEHTLPGMRDQPDVRSIAQLIVIAAAGSPNAPQMVNLLDAIVRELNETFKERLKETAVRQEVERYEDSIRGALRAVRALESVPEIAASRDFQHFMGSVVRSSQFNDRYNSIVQSEADILSYGGRRSADGLAHVHGEDLMRD